MTAPIPPAERPVASSPALAAPARGRRRRWLLLALAVAATASAASWWWLRPASPAPPMPADVADAETRAVIESARREVLRQPRSVEAWGKLAKVLLAQQFDREANVCLGEANRLDPADPRWLYAHCIIVLKRDPDNAVAQLRHAARVADAAAGAWPDYRLAVRLLMAEALLERGQLDEAERIFQAEAMRDARNARVALALGRIALARDDDARAAQMLAIAQSSPHARRQATALLAQIARRRGDKVLADAYERKLAQLSGDAPWPDPLLDETSSMMVGPRGWQRHIKWLEQHQRHAEAAEVCLKRLEQDPRGSLRRRGPELRQAARVRSGIRAVAGCRARRSQQRRCALLARAGPVLPCRARLADAPRGAAAQGVAARSGRARPAHAEVRPGHAKTYMVWGLALKLLGRPAEAVAPLRQGVACNPGDLELQLGLGQVLLETGHGAEAQAYLENARRLAPPGDARPAQALALARQGEVATSCPWRY